MAHLASRTRRLGLDLPIVVSGTDAHDEPFNEHTHTVNVSGGGLCYESQYGVPVGARVELKIALPPKLRPRFGGKSVYRVQALVCRVERTGSKGSYRVGVRFLGDER
jgi:hypothetical protein